MSHVINSCALTGKKPCINKEKKVREKSRECHNHKLQPFPDTKRKRKLTTPNKHKSIKHTKSTKIISLFPKRGNCNAKRTEKHKNRMAEGKPYNKSPRRINHKAPKKYMFPYSHAVNARLHNIQYARTGATELLSSRDVYCPALERALSTEIAFG